MPYRLEPSFVDQLFVTVTFIAAYRDPDLRVVSPFETPGQDLVSQCRKILILVTSVQMIVTRLFTGDTMNRRVWGIDEDPRRPEPGQRRRRVADPRPVTVAGPDQAETIG